MKTPISTSRPAITPQSRTDSNLQKEFIVRGLASRDEVKTSQIYFSSHDVMQSLERKLFKAEATNNL
jgi:hypothetical protein